MHSYDGEDRAASAGVRPKDGWVMEGQPYPLRVEISFVSIRVLEIPINTRFINSIELALVIVKVSFS